MADIVCDCHALPGLLLALLASCRVDSAKRLIDSRTPNKGGEMTKAIAIAAGLAGLLFSLPAQPQGVQLNMTDSDLEQYCFFNGRLFSVGAFFCIEKGKMLQCQVFNKEKDKDRNVGEKAWWATMDRSACSKSDQPR